MKNIVFINPNPAHAVEEALPAVLARALVNRLEQARCTDNVQKAPGLCDGRTEDRSYVSLS